MKRHIATKVHTSLDHHAITTVLGTGVLADDLGQHRQNTTKVPGTEEPEGPGLPLGHTTMKMKKRDWSIVVYSRSLHHTSTQRFQTTP
jgi:hypothetical protein